MSLRDKIIILGLVISVVVALAGEVIMIVMLPITGYVILARTQDVIMTMPASAANFYAEVIGALLIGATGYLIWTMFGLLKEVNVKAQHVEGI